MGQGNARAERIELYRSVRSVHTTRFRRRGHPQPAKLVGLPALGKREGVPCSSRSISIQLVAEDGVLWLTWREKRTRKGFRLRVESGDGVHLLCTCTEYPQYASLEQGSLIVSAVARSRENCCC